MGVTTIVGGPDGYFAPFHIRMLQDSLRHHGSGTNVAVYIGHNGVREAVMGMAQRAPTAEELAPGHATIVAESVNFVPEIGETSETAFYRACQALAKQIVDMMESPW